VTAFVDEIAAHVGLDAADRTRLVALHEVLAPQFSAIADAFYVAARRHACTAPILSNPEQIARLRSMLIDWMSTGLLGPYDDAFATNRARLGHRHAEIGLAQHDVILGMNRVRRAYRRAIVAGYRAPEVHAVSDAVDKLLDLELALMLRDYQQDSEERALAGERRRRFDQITALKTLCAGLAHEVRNPVNSAKLQLELAMRRLRRGGDATLLEPVELADHEIGRLTTLVDEFLAFAQPAALNAQAEDVVALVRDAIEHGRALAEQRGARLTFTADLEPVVAEIDAAKVRQIVGSLVCNALEAVTAGGDVSVAVVPIDGHVHIRVTDDGPGIPADALPRIYEPFFSTKEGGTGMGLSIVHSLVALHHGTTDVASSPAGTTFDVALPRRRALRGTTKLAHS
jgi:signal transduction histidine kinase